MYIKYLHARFRMMKLTAHYEINAALPYRKTYTFLNEDIIGTCKLGKLTCKLQFVT